jgi:hypothetical protein
MKADTIRSVRKICWFLLIATCVFHLWSDGRNIALMGELQRAGESPDSAREQIHWLCTPLNIAAFILLALIAVLSVKLKRIAGRIP